MSQNDRNSNYDYDWDITSRMDDVPRGAIPEDDVTTNGFNLFW